MPAKIIDGNAIAKEVRAQWKERAERLKAKGVVPGLAVIIVGDNPASQVYVRNKVRACAEAGLYSEKIELPANVSEAVLIRKIEELNANPAIHGILVQLPLPEHI
ncbi:MAG: tetrahydrofolate dehydrogenase/cyclohydrolase catalytic domain-containing protein, partial [Burkholderiales bacterium]